MSAPKWTPGEWLRDDDLIYALDVHGKVNRFTAHVHGGYADSSIGEETDAEELEANVDLMIAAPDLLAALEAYCAWMTAHFDDIAEQFRADVGFMAPGKSQPMGYEDGIEDTERWKRWEEWLKNRKAALNEAARAAIAKAKGSEFQGETK